MIGDLPAVNCCVRVGWLVLLAMPIAASGQDDREQGLTPEYDKAITALARAPSPAESATIVRALVADADGELLDRMKCADDDGIAMQSAWEFVRRSLPSIMTDEAQPPDAFELARFVGLIEGRFRVVVPATWSNGLRGAKGYSQDYVFFETVEHLSFATLESGLCVHGAEAREVNREVRLSHARGDVLVPSHLLPKRLSHWPYVVVASDSDTCFLATHGQRSAPFSLHAIDAESNRVLWSSQVWAAGTKQLYTGMGWHQVQVVVQEECVIVFGLADGIAYIEVFKSTDGECSGRFSTDY